MSTLEALLIGAGIGAVLMYGACWIGFGLFRVRDHLRFGIGYASLLLDHLELHVRVAGVPGRS